MIIMSEEFINRVEAKARNIRVSRKHCIEIGRWINGDNVEKAKEKLEQVIEKERPVPFKKHNKNLSHKKGTGPGRYPISAAEEMLEVLKSAEENGKYQGLENMIVSEVIVNQGSRMRTPKRHRGRSPKSAHIDVKLEEKE